MEDYKQKYEEAFERAKGIYDETIVPTPTAKGTCEYIFPELKESEEEKIRKELIEFVKSRGGFKQEYIAWLEKQGEQKVVKFMTKSYITPNPKFFQWIYDRLVYQHHENPNMDYMRSLKERIEDMQEIVNVKTNDVLVRQKSAWSEEDEKILQTLINDTEKTLFAIKQEERYDIMSGLSEIYIERLRWLKSLKERYTWKPSDEQMKQLGWVAEQNKDNIIGKKLMSLYQDLKKLKEE